MSDILQTLANLSVLVFVVSSMLAMGLSLTISQIVGPLKDLRVVVKSLLVNFVVVPILAYLIAMLLNLSDAQSIGLILLATAAGAPFLPKLVQVAKGDLAFSVGLMVLLMVVTVIYLPLVLPLLLPGVSVNPMDIAGSLIMLMLIPLAIGLSVKARFEVIADSLQKTMAQTSNTALMFLIVLALVLNFKSLIGVIGSGAILALLLFIVLCFTTGYFLGDKQKNTRSVLGLGTAQRNISAALVVGAQNFNDPDVVTMLIVGALLMLVILMLTGGVLGKRKHHADQL